MWALPHEIANEVSINTAYGVERVVRYAFALAEKRGKKLTLVHKTNVLTYAGSLWQRTVEAEAANHPDVVWDYLHVDAATIFLVTDPARFDVIVTDNLFGDILTDLAGAISGGIGLAASGNINPDRHVPQHVRAGARIGARHRGAAEGRPHRGDPVGGAPARSPRARRMPPAGSRRRSSADLAERGAQPRTTREVGAAITSRLA